MAWRDHVHPWLRILKEALFGDTPVLAAGVALFTLLATIPGIAAIISIYGLAADPADIGPQLDGLDRVLPRDVVRFVINQLERQASRSSSELGGALVVTLLLALYSARSAADAMIVGLNYAYGVRESRRARHVIALTVLLAFAKLFAFTLIGVFVVALPDIVAWLGVRGDVHRVVDLVRWPILLAALAGGLTGLYRLAPSPRDHDHRRLLPGAFVATFLWFVISYLLSLWVQNVADYEVAYGTFASVLVVLLWFYLSVLAILLGGLVNAELERTDLAPHPTVFPTQR
jgi:membrane protein